MHRTPLPYLVASLCLLSACSGGGGGSFGDGTGSEGPGTGVTDPPAPYPGRSTLGLEGGLPLTGARRATTSDGDLWLCGAEGGLTHLSPAGELVGQWDLAGLPGDEGYCLRDQGRNVIAGRSGNPLSLGSFGADGPVGDWVRISAPGSGALEVLRVAGGRLFVTGVVDGRVLLGALDADRTLDWQLTLAPGGLGPDARVSLEALPDDDLLLWVRPVEGATAAHAARIAPDGAVRFEVEIDAALGPHAAGRTWSLRANDAWSLFEVGPSALCQPAERALVSVSLEDGTPRVQRRLNLEREHLLGWSALPGGDHLLIGGHRAEGAAEVDLWCARLAADGTLLWQRAYPVSAPGPCATDLPLYGDQEARLFANGDPLVVGETRLASGHDRRGRVLMRLDAANGEPVWTRVLSDTLGAPEVRRAEVLPGDRVLVLGVTERLAFDPVEQPFVALVDRAGELVEGNVLPTPVRATLERLVRLENDSYLALGAYGEDGAAAVPVVAHLDPAGRLQWHRRIGDPHTDEIPFGSYLAGGANQLVLTGTTRALGGTAIPMVQTVAPGYDTACQRPIPANPARVGLEVLELVGVETSVTTAALDLVRPVTTVGPGTLTVAPLAPQVAPVGCREVEVCF